MTDVRNSARLNISANSKSSGTFSSSSQSVEICVHDCGLFLKRLKDLLRNLHMLVELSQGKKTRKLIDLARANRIVLVLAVIVSAFSILVFLASMFYPNLISILQSSTKTPWGVLTSIFLHADILHLYGNLVFLWMWTAYIILPYQPPVSMHSFSTRIENNS